MANIEDTDPWLVAARDLTEDLKFKRAEAAGEVVRMDSGLYVVGDDGTMELISAEDVVREVVAAIAEDDEDDYYFDED